MGFVIFYYSMRMFIRLEIPIHFFYVFLFTDEGCCGDEDVVQFAAVHQFLSQDHHSRFPARRNPLGALLSPLQYDPGEQAASESFPHLAAQAV